MIAALPDLVNGTSVTTFMPDFFDSHSCTREHSFIWRGGGLVRGALPLFTLLTNIFTNVCWPGLVLLCCSNSMVITFCKTYVFIIMFIA